MKLIALIYYSDDTDSYDTYRFHTTIPFEAASLEEGKALVMQRVTNDITPIEYIDGEPVTEIPVNNMYFGHSFGEIRKDQYLSVEIMTLEQWFDNNKKDIDCLPSVSY